MDSLHKVASKPAILLSGLAAASVLACTPAHALSWNWSASFAGSFSGTATGVAITDGSTPVIGQTYTITSITGTLSALGESLPITGPNSYQSATNTFTYNGPGTSIFAASANGISWSFPYLGFTVNTNLYHYNNPGSGPGIVNAWRTSFGQSGTVTSSLVTPVPVPTPGPLPLMGAGAAFGWSRRLRRRVKSGSIPAASIHSALPQVG
jgi:hypothetical protein